MSVPRMESSARSGAPGATPEPPRSAVEALNLKEIPGDAEVLDLIHRLKIAADRRYADRQLLLWLHAEAVWHRDRLDDEALKWTELAGGHAEEVELLRSAPSRAEWLARHEDHYQQSREFGAGRAEAAGYADRKTEDELGPQPAEQAEPRLWQSGASEPKNVRRVRDVHGDVWTRSAGGAWESPGTMPCAWDYMVKKWAPLTEVLETQASGIAISDPVAPQPNGTLCNVDGEP